MFAENLEDIENSAFNSNLIHLRSKTHIVARKCERFREASSYNGVSN